MKKIFMLTIVALVLAGFSGCNKDDKTKADVQWTNKDITPVATIQWVSNGATDQTWDGSVAPDATTTPLGITELTGQGECVDNDGKNATILLDAASTGVVGVADGDTSATVQENATATLIIQETAPIAK